VKYEELLSDPRSEEISIYRGGKIYINCGKGMRDTGIRLPHTAIHAVIRLLAAAARHYLDAEAPFANFDLACGARGPS
jgi:Flp pilus assembly CpaF family ATPase